MNHSIKVRAELAGPQASGHITNLLGFLAAFIALLAGSERAFGDAFTISDWLLATSVRNISAGGGQAVYFTNVANPFQESHSASAFGSSAQTQYEFWWDELHGSFSISNSQSATALPSDTIRTSAAGSISITPTEDLSLWVHGSYSYDLHGWMAAILDVGVNDPISHTSLFSQYQDYDTIDGPPYSGTFYVNANVVLPAGTTWVMGYAMQTFAEPGSGSPTGTGMGFLTFEVTPEPTTLTLLLPLLLMVFRHGGRPFKHSDA